MMCSNHQLQFTSLNSKHDDLNNKYEKLKSEHADVQEDNRKLNARVDSLENELENCKNENLILRNDNSKLLKENIKVCKMLRNAIISRNEKENELIRLRLEYENVRRENADLREARSVENIRISVDNNAAVASDAAMHNSEETALKDHKLPSEPVMSYETVGNCSDNPIAEEINSINSTCDNSGKYLKNDDHADNNTHGFCCTCF